MGMSICVITQSFACALSQPAAPLQIRRLGELFDLESIVSVGCCPAIARDTAAAECSDV